MSIGIIIWAVKIIERTIITITITTTTKSTLCMGNIIINLMIFWNTIMIKSSNNSTTGNNLLLLINLHMYCRMRTILSTIMTMIIINAFHTIPIIRIVWKKTIITTTSNITTTSITKDNSNHKSHHHQKSPNKSNVHLGLYWGGILHLIITKTIKTINMLIIM